MISGRSVPSHSIWKSLCIAISLLFVGLWIAELREIAGAWQTEGTRLGMDLHLYLKATREWIAGEAFYPTRQLAGPYDVLGMGEILYPPNAILLFAPFVVLPEALWWLIPGSSVAAVLWYWRPAPHGWPLLAFILWWPRTNQDVLTGNPAIWIAAFAALATIRGGIAVLALLKPTLAPVALIWWS